MRSRSEPEGTKDETQEVVARPTRISRSTRTAPMVAVPGASAHVVYPVPGVVRMAVRVLPSIPSGWAS